jgi:hypothetical protein
MPQGVHCHFQRELLAKCHSHVSIEILNVVINSDLYGQVRQSVRDHKHNIVNMKSCTTTSLIAWRWKRILST